MKIMNRGYGQARIEISIPFSAEEKDYKKNHNTIDSASSQSKLFVTDKPDVNNPINAVEKLFRYFQKLPNSVSSYGS